MSDLIVGAIGAVVGVGSLIAALAGYEWIKGWRYRQKRLQELRHRPHIPWEFSSMKVMRMESGWYVEVFGRNEERLGTSSGDHPVEAIIYAATDLNT